MPRVWAGIAVSSCKHGCWGTSHVDASGRPIRYLRDLEDADSLVFHARGGLSDEIITVMVAVSGHEPLGDSAASPAEKEIQLTQSWGQYTLNLKGMDLRRVVTPFAVAVERPKNNKTVTIYLDEIYFLMRHDPTRR